MANFERLPIDTSNTEQRTPCVLVLDISGSMAGPAIDALNAGLVAFERDLKAHPKASVRCEIAVVTFGGSADAALVVQDFQTVSQFKAPHLEANHSTPMGAAIDLALQLVNDRKRAYRTANLNYTRPWLFLITDGQPTDSWEEAAARLVQEEQNKGVVVYCVGVEGADMSILARLSTQRKPLKLQALKFSEMLLWLSNSQQRVSAQKPGETSRNEDPSGWAETPT